MHIAPLTMNVACLLTSFEVGRPTLEMADPLQNEFMSPRMNPVSVKENLLKAYMD